MHLTHKTILSIAGSDPVAGAGIQADIKTAEALQTYALTVVTAVTAQNSAGVKAVMSAGGEMVRLQLEAVAEDVCPGAVKIGMIPDAAVAEAVADFLERRELRNVVVDPVMIASSGNTLSPEPAVEILKHRIFPRATLLTPNVPEAEKLTGRKIRGAEEALEAGRAILAEFGCRGVLMKGGHMPQQDSMTDILLYTDGPAVATQFFTHPIIKTANTHGTGCTLSSAIAAGLANGLDLENAVGAGIRYLQEALMAGSEYDWGEGKKNGPMKHNINNIQL